MNILLGAIVLCICTYFGYLYGQKYVEKRKFYEDFSSFNKKFINEVSYSMKTLPQIIAKENNNQLFYKTINNYVQTKTVTINEKFLTDDEKNYFKNYLETLGSSDRDSQLSFLNASLNTINEYLSLAQKDEKKFRSLYLKIGFLIGLIAFIALL